MRTIRVEPTDYGGVIRRLAFSKDGNALGIWEGTNDVTISVRWWNLAKNAEARMEYTVADIDYWPDPVLSADLKLLVFCGHQDTACVDYMTLLDTRKARAYDPGSVSGSEGRPGTRILGGYSDAQSYGPLLFAPGGKYLVVSVYDDELEAAELRCWNVAAALKREQRGPYPPPIRDEEARAIRVGEEAEVVGLAFRPDSRELAAVASEGTVWRYEFPSGTVLPPLPVKGKSRIGNQRIAYAPGRNVLAAGWSRDVVLWDLGSARRQATLKLDADFQDLAFHPGGKQLAVATAGSVGFWDIASGTERQRYNWDIGPPRSVAFSPDGLT